MGDEHSVLELAWSRLLPGLWVTLRVFGLGSVLMIVMSIAAGMLRMARNPVLRGVAVGYIDLFRGTAALVQLFFAVYALPHLLPVRYVDAELAGIVVLGLNGGAYGAEVVRGAVRAVPRGQWEAASALGLTRLQTTWRVAMPQAAIAMLPPFGNLLVELSKNTALVSLVSINDLTFEGRSLNKLTQETLLIYGLLLLVYFAIALVVSRIPLRLERVLSRRLGLHGAR